MRAGVISLDMSMDSPLPLRLRASCFWNLIFRPFQMQIFLQKFSPLCFMHYALLALHCTEGLPLAVGPVGGDGRAGVAGAADGAVAGGPRPPPHHPPEPIWQVEQ